MVLIFATVVGKLEAIKDDGSWKEGGRLSHDELAAENPESGWRERVQAWEGRVQAVLAENQRLTAESQCALAENRRLLAEIERLKAEI